MTAAKTVSRASPGFLGRRCDHDRDDQCRLDHRDGQGEDKRAERLTDAVRNHLRVVHGREHRAEQDDAGSRGDESPAAEEKCHQQDQPSANAGHVQVHQGVRAAAAMPIPKLNHRQAPYSTSMARTLPVSVVALVKPVCQPSSRGGNRRPDR